MTNTADTADNQNQATLSEGTNPELSQLGTGGFYYKTCMEMILNDLRSTKDTVIDIQYIVKYLVDFDVIMPPHFALEEGEILNGEWSVQGSELHRLSKDEVIKHNIAWAKARYPNSITRQTQTNPTKD